MTAPVLQTKGLGHTYGPLRALHSVSLDVPKGAVFGFLGPNGAGKTTAIRCILGLIKAQQGQVFINGHNIKTNRNAALQGVGAVVETPALFTNLTGRENLRITSLMIDAPPTAIDRVLDIVDMRAHANRKLGHYSLGMRQRLGLARALLGSPSLLVLDEPTNGLDPAGIRDMRALIRRLPGVEGTTVFMSSHLLNEIEHTASHVGLMQSGALIFQGTLETMMAMHPGTLYIGVDQPKKAKAIAHAQGGVVHKTGKDFIEITMPDADAAQSRAALNGALVKAGLNVHAFYDQPADLEDIFLTLTASKNDEAPS